MTTSSGRSGGGGQSANQSGSLSGGQSRTLRAAPNKPNGTGAVLQSLIGDADGNYVSNIKPIGDTSTQASVYSGTTLQPPRSISPEGGGSGTTVTQKPAAGETPAPAAGDGAEGTTVTSGPRSDFSVVLAGQTGRRPERSAARSNNFVSLVGGAGGLGRRTDQSRRTLIGGA